MNIYRITLDESEYANLMRLVMKYGTGAGPEGVTTSVDLRAKLAEPEINPSK